MSELNPHDPHGKDTCIAAQAGTPDYQRRFEQQALAAADLTLRVGIVRVACGFLGLIFLAGTIIEMIDVVNHARRFLTPVFSAAATAELLFVAIRGKSFYLRFMLAGVRQQKAERRRAKNHE
jgi:hypothetical protein